MTGMGWGVHTMGQMRGRNFLAWHRRFIYRFEQRLRKVHPAVTLPYWEALVDRAIPAPLADPALLASWSVTRAWDPAQLAPAADLKVVMGLTSFQMFQPTIEGAVHASVHNAVGGDMARDVSLEDALKHTIEVDVLHGGGGEDARTRLERGQCVHLEEIRHAVVTHAKVDAAVVADLEAALAHVDRVFQPHYRKPVPLCMYCDLSPAAYAQSPEMARFDAVVRAHRARRLIMPIHGIWDISLGHTLGIFHNDIRRLAWFVPPLLATTLDEAHRTRALEIVLRAGLETSFVTTFESYPGDPPWFTDAELTALDDFLVALLPQLSTSECSTVLGIGHYFRSNQQRLAETWLGLDPSALPDAVLGWGTEDYLEVEPVRAALETVVLTTTDGVIAARCSEAEDALRARLGSGARD